MFVLSHNIYFIGSQVTYSSPDWPRTNRLLTLIGCCHARLISARCNDRASCQGNWTTNSNQHYSLSWRCMITLHHSFPKKHDVLFKYIDWLFIHNISVDCIFRLIIQHATFNYQSCISSLPIMQSLINRHASVNCLSCIT